MNRLISKLDRCLFNNKIIKHKYNNKQLLAIQNYIECEAHRELMLVGLQSFKSIKKQ